MKKFKKDLKIPKQRNLIAYDLLTNGLYKHKVIKNKKKEVKKYDWKKDSSYYLNTLFN